MARGVPELLALSQVSQNMSAFVHGGADTAFLDAVARDWGINREAVKGTLAPKCVQLDQFFWAVLGSSSICVAVLDSNPYSTEKLSTITMTDRQAIPGQNHREIEWLKYTANTKGRLRINFRTRLHLPTPFRFCWLNWLGDETQGFLLAVTSRRNPALAVALAQLDQGDNSTHLASSHLALFSGDRCLGLLPFQSALPKQPKYFLHPAKFMEMRDGRVWLLATSEKEIGVWGFTPENWKEAKPIDVLPTFSSYTLLKEGISFLRPTTSNLHYSGCCCWESKTGKLRARIAVGYYQKDDSIYGEKIRVTELLDLCVARNGTAAVNFQPITSPHRWQVVTVGKRFLAVQHGGGLGLLCQVGYNPHSRLRYSFHAHNLDGEFLFNPRVLERGIGASDGWLLLTLPFCDV